MDVANGGNPGADVQKLVDALLNQEPDAAAQEGPVDPRRQTDVGVGLGQPVSRQPIDLKVVIAA